MKILTVQPTTLPVSIQTLQVGNVFRLFKNGSTLEKDIVDGEFYLKIHPLKILNTDESIQKNTVYVKLSDQFEMVQRSGPIMGIPVDYKIVGETPDPEYKTVIAHIEYNKAFVTLENLFPGDCVNFINEEDTFMIITNPVDSEKMVNVLNLTHYTVVRLHKDSACAPVKMFLHL